MRVILASASPRRKELLGKIFPEFTIHVSSCEENAVFESPSQYVEQLAEQKAYDVACHHINNKESTLVIGADTIVYHNGKVLGKPKSRQYAYNMILSLSGNTHEVYTGISLIYIDKQQLNIYPPTYSCTRVSINELTEAEILNYIDSPISSASDGTNVYEWADKAGGYAIQGYFSRHITGIDGDYFNVVGLPVHRLYEELKRHNLLDCLL